MHSHPAPLFFGNSASSTEKSRRQWAVLGIEPRTSRTLSENHATRPNSQLKKMCLLMWLLGLGCGHGESVWMPAQHPQSSAWHCGWAAKVSACSARLGPSPAPDMSWRGTVPATRHHALARKACLQQNDMGGREKSGCVPHTSVNNGICMGLCMKPAACPSGMLACERFVASSQESQRPSELCQGLAWT